MYFNAVPSCSLRQTLLWQHFITFFFFLSLDISVFRKSVGLDQVLKIAFGLFKDWGLKEISVPDQTL